jgi:hypothetical protein
LRLPADEPADFGARTARLATLATGAAVGGLALAVVLGIVHGNGFRRFYFAYLTALGFFLMISLGALCFVLLQHVSRAGWSVNVRRLAEHMAALLPVLGVLSLPIVLSVILQKGDLYPWALPHHAASAEAHHDAKHEPKPSAAGGASVGEHKSTPGSADTGGHGADAEEHGGHEADPGRGNRHLDELTLKKRSYLNPLMFIGRMVLYFLIWSAIALYYLRHSTQQDVDGDYRHTALMQKWAGISLVLFGLTVTFAAFDLFMTLDPHWYSTMFGVYYFASGMVSFFAAMILSVTLMQRAGYLREAVTIEHYHDLGKFMFAFTFFWGYVTFSQFMLLWYASLPETTTWMSRRGATTMDHPPGYGNEWKPWALVVTVGCFLLPFPGLLSRIVKRNRKAVTFWACWLLVFQFCNIFWIVMPEMRAGFPRVPAIELASLVGIGGVCLLVWLRLTAKHKIRPVNDPRVFESAAFVNV